MSLRGRRWTGALEITTLGIIGDPDPARSAIEATILAAAATGRLSVEVTVEGGQTRVRAIAAAGAVPAPTTRPALDRRAAPPAPGGDCHGRLIIHDDASTSCHSGREDCWPGITAYRHQGTPIPCHEMSHGCGQCLTTQGGTS